MATPIGAPSIARATSASAISGPGGGAARAIVSGAAFITGTSTSVAKGHGRRHDAASAVGHASPTPGPVGHADVASGPSPSSPSSVATIATGSSASPRGVAASRATSSRSLAHRSAGVGCAPCMGSSTSGRIAAISVA